MIYITQTISTIQLEKHLRPGLPAPNTFKGLEFIIEFQYKSASKSNSLNRDKVFAARFVKERYYEKAISKNVWRWVYKGITDETAGSRS